MRQLVRIEHGRALGQAVRVEDRDQLLAVEDLFFAFRRPAQQRDKVEHRFRQIAQFFILRDELDDRFVPFAELFVVVAHDQRHMRETRRFPAQRFVDHELARRVGDMVFPAQHVRDLHQVVVDDDREVIRRDAVAFDDDEIARVFGGKRNFAFDHIVEGVGLVLRHAETHARHAAFGFERLALLRRQIAVSARITRRLAGVRLLFAFFFQFFFGAVAQVSQPFVEQFLPVDFINIETFGLAVRSVFSADIDAFVPIDAQPFHVFQLAFFAAGHVAFHVGILDANDEFAPLIASEQIIEQRRSGVADMQMARRARRVTYAYFLSHDRLPPVSFLQTLFR